MRPHVLAVEALAAHQHQAKFNVAFGSLGLHGEVVQSAALHRSGGLAHSASQPRVQRAEPSGAAVEAMLRGERSGRALRRESSVDTSCM